MNYKIRLVKPYLPSLQEISPELSMMLDSGRLSNFGPFSDRLEGKTEALLGVSHAATVSSATTGLCLLLNTLPPNSEVVLPSFTFVATIQALAWNQLVPVFADIDPGTLNVSPSSVASCLSPRTSAILGVHAFGVPCEVESLRAIADERQIPVFFDAAHAFGSRRRGNPVGIFGDAEVFSLSATKLVPSGEGGLVTTNHSGIHQAMLDRRNYGLKADGSKDCENHGLNGKLPEFSAILALKEIETLEWRVTRRNEIAKRYKALLGNLPGISFQHVDSEDLSVVKDLTIQVDPDLFGIDRDVLRRRLAAEGIESAPYFWPALHQMSHFSESRRAPDGLSVTERVTDRILSLPIYETLSDAEIEEVARVVSNAHVPVESAVGR